MSMDRWYKKNGIEDAKELLTLVSVNTRDLPKSIDELKLDNNSVGIKFILPIVSELHPAIIKASQNFREFFTQMTILGILKVAKVLPYLSIFLQQQAIKTFYSSVGLTYSNVPCSNEPWFILNKEVTKIGVFAHQQHNWRLFFVAATYRRKLRLSVVANENLKMDPQQLINNALEIIKQDIEENCKDD